MVAPQPDAIIEVPPAFRRAEALELLHLGRPRIQRLLSAEERGRVDMQGLYWARREDHPVGVAWGQVVPGRTAFCWPARLMDSEPEDTAMRLQMAADQYLDAAGVIVTQALLNDRAGRDATRLTRAGYHYLADLDYLVSFIDCFPQERPVSDLQFWPICVDDQARLAGLIERTYAGSLDCPQLGGVRPIEDVLRGYRETGVYRRDWWLVATHHGQDVGCALLADHPANHECELIYLGVLPEMRGHGWGLQITRYVQWLMRTAPRQRILLALDGANWPAQSVYGAAGFERWDRRTAFIRTARSPASKVD